MTALANGKIRSKKEEKIANKKAWGYGKTGFKDVSERNPKIGEKKGNHRVKKATGRYRMRRKRCTPQVMCLARCEPLVPMPSIAIWSKLFRVPSYHFGRNSNDHKKKRTEITRNGCTEEKQE